MGSLSALRPIARSHGEIEAAFASYAKAIELMEGLSAADPGDTGHRRWLSVSYSSIGDLHARIDQPLPALEHYRRAIAISEELAREPDHVETRRDLAKFHQATGAVLATMSQTDAALAHLNKAIALAETSAAQDPENGRVRSRLAEVCAALGALYQKRAEHSAAESPEQNASLRTACDWYRRNSTLWAEIKSVGMLSSLDADKPEAAARGLDQCEAALRAPTTGAIGRPGIQGAL